MRLRGVAHVHSTYSYDGCHPLAELVAFFRGRGLDFALLSEHVRTLDARAVTAIVAECRALSDDRFLVVPGLEYEATPDFVHVLAYNVQTATGARDVPTIARTVREAGGLAVLAHPHYRRAFEHVPGAALGLLNGWEVWNGKADGRFAPDADNVRRHAAVRVAHPGLRAFGGVDLHRLESYADITLEVECGDRRADSLLDALARGQFDVAGPGLRFRGDAAAPLAGGSARAGLAETARTARRWAQRLDRRFARMGLQAPAPIYRLARRIFR